MNKLSICIPTYNRSDKCLRLVNEILKSSNQNIEIIVSDNCSTDDTFELLQQIDDKRLFIYQMKENIGSLLNIYTTFSKATGEFIYFTTDKDFINISNIDEFMLFLEANENLSCGYCEYSPKSEAINEIYPQGFEAINRIGYIGHHPSGYFFQREKLESINYIEKFSDKKFVGEFFLDFILVELSYKGDAGVFCKELTIPQDNNDAAHDKSLSIRGMNINAYYTPQSRLNMTINQTIHVNSLDLLLEEKKSLIVSIFRRGLINATFGYRNILINKNICEHYHLKSRKVGIWEIGLISINFYMKYLQKTNFERNQNGLSFMHFNFYFFDFVFKKIVKIVKIVKNAK